LSPPLRIPLFVSMAPFRVLLFMMIERQPELLEFKLPLA
jgi:hypothetical protein